MSAKLSVELFERFHSLKVTFVEIRSFLVEVLSIGFLAVKRYSLRTPGSWLEDFVDFVSYVFFQREGVTLRGGGLTCEVRRVGLYFEWATPIDLFGPLLEALIYFVDVVLHFALAVPLLSFVVGKERIDFVGGVELLRLRVCGLAVLNFVTCLTFILRVGFVVIVSLFFNLLRAGGGHSIGKLSFFVGLTWSSLALVWVAPPILSPVCVLSIGLGCTAHPTHRILFYLFLALFCALVFGIGLCGFLLAPRLFVQKIWRFSLWWTFGVYLGGRGSIGWSTG